MGDPGGPHPGQQVDVGFVFGQDHRTLGQLVDRLPQRGQGVVAVGVALGDQPRPPPASDLAGAPVQGPQRHGGTAKPLPEPQDRPRVGFGQQPADPLAEPGAAQPRSASSGPVGQPGDPVLVVAVDPAAHGGRVAAQQLGDRSRRPAAVRQQDHDQAGAQAVGAMQHAEHVAGTPGRAGAVGVHAGGTHTDGGLVGSFGVWKLQRPTRLLRATARPPPSRNEQNFWSPA
jgi:hypothetical protein